MRIIIETKRSHWHIERVPHWTWRWNVGVGDLLNIWRESFWRVGPLHVKRYLRINRA